MTNDQIVTDFCMSLEHSEAGFEPGRYLAEEVEYLNVPLEPIYGREAAKAFLTPFVGAGSNCLARMEIPVTTSAGNFVMNERMEYWVKGDVRVDLPVAGVFELRDGLIVSWRDYFDLPTLQPLLDAVLG
ncbi:MAG: limonene-1,2-epoxide hydrolase [Salinisphaeraceae bacterium]|jgi:limonene-1,2-epoxide hydrolase|nr:limonene-1,2-epoxide hydrolase [Salinisphaeraceae bacterium]